MLFFNWARGTAFALIWVQGRKTAHNVQHVHHYFFNFSRVFRAVC